VRHLHFPLHFDPQGRTADADDRQYIRQLLEQLLFTAPGERVNRPTFGCAITQLVFAPNSGELAAATQLLIQASLQQWLGDLIAVTSVEVAAEDATLRVDIQYRIRSTQQSETAVFTQGAAG
jgi:phage baseplate assembly protein W